MDVGSFLKQVRMEKNISIRQLAQFTGISPAYISQIENGKRKNPKQYILRTLFDGLGMDYDHYLSLLTDRHQSEVHDQSLTYEEMRNLSAIDKSLEQSTLPFIDQIDLYDLLQENHSVYFKGKLLSKKDIEKVNVVLQALFD